MTRTVQWELNKKPLFLISSILALLAIIAMFILIGQGVYRPLMPDNVAYPVLGIATLVLLFAIRRGSRRKFVKIADVKVQDTKMNELNSDAIRKEQSSNKDLRGASLSNLESSHSTKV